MELDISPIDPALPAPEQGQGLRRPGQAQQGRTALAQEPSAAYSETRAGRYSARAGGTAREVRTVHPYYAPAVTSTWAGMVSMAAYLTFWAVVVTVAARQLQRRFPLGTPLDVPVRDRAMTVLRERYARGDLDREQFLQMGDDLRRTASGGGWATARGDGAR